VCRRLRTRLLVVQTGKAGTRKREAKGWNITYGLACPVLGLLTASSESFRLPVVRYLALFTPRFASFHSLSLCTTSEPILLGPSALGPTELRLSGFGHCGPSPIVQKPFKLKFTIGGRRTADMGNRVNGTGPGSDSSS